MKIAFIHILLLILIPFETVMAQPVDGIWFSSHDIHFRTVTERFDLLTTDDGELSSTSYKLDSVEVDTFYYPGGMILQFPKPKEVILKPLGWDGLPAKYLKRRGLIKTKKAKYHVDFTDGSEIILREKLRKDIRSEEHFKKLVPSKLERNESSDSFEFENTAWSVHSDTSSIFDGMSLHIIDSTRVIITRKLPNEIYTDNGKWVKIWYENHLFFGFHDNYNMRGHIFHFYEKGNGTLIGDAFESHIFADAPPQLRQIVLEEKSLLNDKEIKRIENKLIGDWTAINEPLFIDSLFYNYVTSTNNLPGAILLNQHFELTFSEDHTFRIFKSGVIKYGEHGSKIDTTISGNWKLSSTGNYIQIKANNSYYRYLSLSKLTDNFMDLYFDMIALSEDKSMRNIENRFVKLEK